MMVLYVAGHWEVSLSKATKERQLQSEAMNITPETEPTVNETITDSNKDPLIYKSLSRGPEL